MEGRAHLVCGDCGRTTEISGEMPHEYRDCFHEKSWVPRPGTQLVLICDVCAAKYEGHETREDAAKI